MTKLENLQPGDKHYKAYVGPPLEYDFMGATQFRLLTALGLRGHHRLLDFGCGSLRAGRLFIPYLNPGNYFGIEPNQWLIEDAISHELGNDIIKIKQPSFSFNDNWKTDVFGKSFDFILAQSIFSHTGKDLISKALEQFRLTLTAGGKILATFYEGSQDHQKNGWVYPHIAIFKKETINELINASGLHGIQLPWYHPRQTWYLLSSSPDSLPDLEAQKFLNGFFLGRDNLRTH